jgi:hypothetical protein
MRTRTIVERLVLSFVPAAFAFTAACGGTVVGVGPDGGGGGDGSAPPSLAACSGPGVCQLTSRSCCGTCGQPTVGDMVGVHMDKESAYRSLACSGGDQACPACAGQPNPDLTAVCRKQTCQAVDVSTDDALSGCNADTDCVLRYANTCCEPCGGAPAGELIALSTSGSAEYRANVCRPDSGACSRCLVAYPPLVKATCNPQTKHCEVFIPPPG